MSPIVPPQVVEPVVQRVTVGANVMFMVPFNSSHSYQWQHNETMIEGQNMSNLTLSMVNKMNAGNYTCIVTSDGENFTSTTAKLFVCESAIS